MAFHYPVHSSRRLLHTTTTHPSLPALQPAYASPALPLPAHHIQPTGCDAHFPFVATYNTQPAHPSAPPLPPYRRALRCMPRGDYSHPLRRLNVVTVKTVGTTWPMTCGCCPTRLPHLPHTYTPAYRWTLSAHTPRPRFSCQP